MSNTPHPELILLPLAFGIDLLCSQDDGEAFCKVRDQSAFSVRRKHSSKSCWVEASPIQWWKWEEKRVRSPRDHSLDSAGE
jgi:hypothetical protein